MPDRPLISVIVIGYDMPEQLLNTARSLATDYQQGISADEYEVLIVENRSSNNVDEQAILALGDHFRFFRRENTGRTPVPAINFAFGQARGELVGLMIDGARMLSPGVLRQARDLYRQHPKALVAVPGYHLGQDEQHKAGEPALLRQREKAALASINWPSNGYDLFSISTFSGANRRGYLQPLMECNCLFSSAKHFEDIGYADERFTLGGGGSVNLHMYRSLGLLPDTKLFILPGEGSFHQYHGGVTTSSYAERQAEIESHRVQLHSFWPGGFHSLRRKPALYGPICEQATGFLSFSEEMAQRRQQRLERLDLPEWPDDPE